MLLPSAEILNEDSTECIADVYFQRLNNYFLTRRIFFSILSSDRCPTKTIWPTRGFAVPYKEVRSARSSYKSSWTAGLCFCQAFQLFSPHIPADGPQIRFWTGICADSHTAVAASSMSPVKLKTLVFPSHERHSCRLSGGIKKPAFKDGKFPEFCFPVSLFSGLSGPPTHQFDIIRSQQREHRGEQQKTSSGAKPKINWA